MLINLRNALMAGKRTPTAKDYVQNGLVAMWDGIENAGWGTHDATAGTWKDLTANGFDLTTATGMSFVTWGENCANISENSGLIAQGNFTFLDRKITVEIVTDITISGNNIGIVAINKQGTAYLRQTVGYRIAGNVIYVACGGVQSSLGVNGRLNLVFASEEDGNGGVKISSYRAGLLIGTKTITPTAAITGGTVELFKTSASNWSGGLNGKVYACRLYSRALTAQEIAANYAIDKARFGLS